MCRPPLNLQAGNGPCFQEEEGKVPVLEPWTGGGRLYQAPFAAAGCYPTEESGLPKQRRAWVPPSLPPMPADGKKARRTSACMLRRLDPSVASCRCPAGRCADDGARTDLIFPCGDICLCARMMSCSPSSPRSHILIFLPSFPTGRGRGSLTPYPYSSVWVPDERICRAP